MLPKRFGTGSDGLNRRLYWLAALFLVAAAAALAVDVPLATFCQKVGVFAFVDDLLELAEVFGHGLGAACILLTAYMIDAGRRRRLARIVVSVVGAGLVADLLKLIVGRVRPRVLIVDRIGDSFIGWLPRFLQDPPPGGSVSGYESFPSGHAMVATALAIGFSTLYPRGRWLFAWFAVLAALQRVESLAHYLSDTLAGAAIACFFCGLCFDSRVMGRWFDRWEGNGVGDALGNRCDFPDEPLG